MYYSTILFSEIADLNLTQYHNCVIDMDILNKKDKIIVYCLHHMNYLNKLYYFLEKVEKPFIIITGMEDTEFPKEVENNLIETIKRNNFFKHWFAINKTIPNDKFFTSIPYGLDFWILSTKSHFGEVIQSFKEQNDNLTNIVKSSCHFTKRNIKIFNNSHLNHTDGRYGHWRCRIPHIINNNIIDHQSHILPRYESFKLMSTYAFVLSPFGNGLDCIRTFEALCLGCIVILQKSDLNSMYDDLPVVFVNNWEEVNEQLLNDTITIFSDKTFNYEKLKLDYWLNLIYSKF